MNKAFTPSPRALGTRKLASVRADVDSFVSWVIRQSQIPGRTVRAEIRTNSVVVWLDLDDDHALPIARVQLREGYWHLQWADRSDDWRDYDDKAYLTLAIPMDLINQDPGLEFWG